MTHDTRMPPRDTTRNVRNMTSWRHEDNCVVCSDEIVLGGLIYHISFFFVLSRLFWSSLTKGLIIIQFLYRLVWVVYLQRYHECDSETVLFQIFGGRGTNKLLSCWREAMMKRFSCDCSLLRPSVSSFAFSHQKDNPHGLRA